MHLDDFELDAGVIYLLVAHELLVLLHEEQKLFQGGVSNDTIALE